MNLQQKTLLAFSILLCIVLAALIIFISAITLSNYSVLEQQYVEQNLDQARKMLDDEIRTLGTITTDWGPWDDTYNFVLGTKADYVKTNLLPETYHNLHLNLVVITDKSGSPVYSGLYDSETEEVNPVPEAVLQHLSPELPLMDMSDPRHATAGVLMLSDHPMLVASWPVVHTDFSGEPVGVILMGRYLDPKEVSRLDELISPILAISRIDDSSLSFGQLDKVRLMAESGVPFIETVDNDRIAGYSLIRDIYGNDALILSVTEPRNIYNEGVFTARQFIFIILGLGLFLGLVVIILLDRWVLSRVEDLRSQVHSITLNKDFSQRVEMSGDDEFTTLSSEIDFMLENIEKSHKDLAASEVRFREMSDLLPQIIFELDTDANLTYINKYGLELFGLSKRDLKKGLHASRFMAPDDIPKMQMNLKKVSLGNKSPGDIYTLITKDEKTIRAIIFTSPIIRDGRLEGFRGSGIDVTERLKLEDALTRSEEQYRALAENIADVIFSLDNNGVFTYISPLVDRYGYTPDEIIGKSFTLFIHPDDRQRIIAMYQREMAEGASLPSTFRVLDKQGRTCWFEANSTIKIDHSGNPAGLYGILRDVTERKRAEDAIELANKKMNLMNNITRHDILNTITGLFGFVDMANVAETPEERADLLVQIKNLAKIIQRQIAFTKEYQEVGVHLPRWQDLNELIDRVLKSFENPGVSINVDLLDTDIYADPMLEKVIYNLIDNAIRYGDKITRIDFYYYISDSGFVLICEDDGVGIPQAQKKDIFERGIGRNTGMGLFLTREILGITGISIRENGIPGQGARFEILIPQGTFRFGRGTIKSG
jgi:PAS domain S-box-containing protein